jgi:hypothetical protein
MINTEHRDTVLHLHKSVCVLPNYRFTASCPRRHAGGMVCGITTLIPSYCKTSSIIYRNDTHFNKRTVKADWEGHNFLFRAGRADICLLFSVKIASISPHPVIFSCNCTADPRLSPPQAGAASLPRPISPLPVIFSCNGTADSRLSPPQAGATSLLYPISPLPVIFSCNCNEKGV